MSTSLAQTHHCILGIGRSIPAMASEDLTINSTNAEFGGVSTTETVVGVNRKVS